MGRSAAEAASAFINPSSQAGRHAWQPEEVAMTVSDSLNKGKKEACAFRSKITRNSCEPHRAV
jgi:hypothetical protein